MDAIARFCKLDVMYGPRTSAYIFNAGFSPLLRWGPWKDAEPIAEHNGAR
jgi:hypothetical protein